MPFRLPTPLHGWRAFIGEVGVVVLGVLLALGAGQIAEFLRDRADLRDAEDAMTAELRDDDLPQAFTRAAIYNCYASQLDELQAAVASGNRPEFLSLARAYHPVFRTWDDEAWKAALASQVLVPAGSKRMIGWARPYIIVPILSQTALAENDELTQLWANLGGTGPLSTEQQDRLFQVIAVLRGRNRGMTASSLVFMRVAGERGLTLAPERKRSLLAEARQTYGACARETSPDRLKPNSQLNYLNGVFGNHE
jgi:hypothetical protein